MKPLTRPTNFSDYIEKVYGKDFDFTKWKMTDMEKYLKKNKLSAVIMIFDTKRRKSVVEVDFIKKNLETSVTEQVAFLFQKAATFIMGELAGPRSGDAIH